MCSLSSLCSVRVCVHACVCSVSVYVCECVCAHVCAHVNVCGMGSGYILFQFRCILLGPQYAPRL